MDFYGKNKSLKLIRCSCARVVELREEVEKKEKWINVLINSKSFSVYQFSLLIAGSVDHGVSLPHPIIVGICIDAHGICTCANQLEQDEAEQTPEGISKLMFEEEFERWSVVLRLPSLPNIRLTRFLTNREETYRINTASYYFTTFAFLPLLAAAKTIGGAAECGNVLNLGSMSGITKTSQHGQFNYNAGKVCSSVSAIQCRSVLTRSYRLQQSRFQTSLRRSLLGATWVFELM